MLHPLSESDAKKLFANSHSIEAVEGRPGGTGTRASQPAYVKIQQGKCVFEYLKLRCESSILEKAVVEGHLRLPCNFWPSFFKNVVKRVGTKAMIKIYRQTLYFYMRSLPGGATTVTGTALRQPALPYYSCRLPNL